MQDSANTPPDLTFDRLLETLAEKIAVKLCEEPSRLYPRLLTVGQAAAYLGLTTIALQILISTNKIPTVLAEGRLLLDREDLDRWIDDNKLGWASI